MPDWSAEVVGISVSGLIGVGGVVVAVIALFKSSTANRHAKDANRIAEEANEIAKRVLVVQQRGIEVSTAAEQRNRSADLHTRPPALHAKRSTVRFWVENRGSHDAYDVTLKLHYGAAYLSFGQQERIAVGGGQHFSEMAGQFISNLDNSKEECLELRASYRDGTGPPTETWRVTVGAGDQFMNRKWIVEKFHQGDQL